jgi:predicted patatin/cPLA2 family phospholipase
VSSIDLIKPVRINANLTGIDADAICSEIQNYLREKKWRDGVKMGVIFEGGALRGVVSAGYGLALSKYIESGSLFSIYGSSSGALNAVYFATKQLEVALKIYEENATDPKCTNIWKFPNILNPDWLVDEWLFDKRKFDLEKLKTIKPDIWLSLTNIDTGLPHYFNARAADPGLLRQAMKATSYAPLVSNGVQIIDGARYGDGAISDAIPYSKAVTDGCTHLICLLTRPPEYRKSHTKLATALETLRLLHRSKIFRAAYFARDQAYSSLLDRLLLLGAPGQVPTLIFHPGEKSEVPGNLETKPQMIASKGRLAYEKSLSVLSQYVK